MKEAMQVEHDFFTGTDILDWNFTEKKLGVISSRANNCKERAAERASARRDRTMGRSDLGSSGVKIKNGVTAFSPLHDKANPIRKAVIRREAH